VLLAATSKAMRAEKLSNKIFQLLGVPANMDCPKQWLYSGHVNSPTSGWFPPTLSYSSTLSVCSNQVTESHYLQQQLDSYNASRSLAQLSLLNIIAMVVVIFSLLLLLLLLLLNKS